MQQPHDSQRPVICFTDLPNEIRTQVYRHLFEGIELRCVKWLNINHSNSNDTRNQFLMSTINHSIVLVSRHIRDEAVVALYQHSKICFDGRILSPPRSSLWPVNDMCALFPTYHAASGIRSTRELVRHVRYEDRDIHFLQNPGRVFSCLKLLELDVGYDHYGRDETFLGRAMRQIRRNGELRHTIKDYLERDYHSSEVSHALFELQKLGRQERGFEVTILWALGYRFLEFSGTCDLDEWILKVRDAELNDGKIYEIPQDPLFCEMS